MKIFYFCYGSAHSSITTCNIHLGHLPQHRRATMKEIMTQPWFDRTESFEVGGPVLMGTDEWGSEIYSLGLAGGQEAMVPALRKFLAEYAIPPEEAAFLDSLAGVGVLMRIGGFTSRKLKLIPVGRPVVTAGTWQKYGEFLRLASRGRAASEAAMASALP